MRAEAERIGTLFRNPGGPGDSGTAYLPAAIGGFPERVRDRFDIVSWDPRGMGGRSTPVVQCFDSAEAEAAFLETNLPDGLPVTRGELARNAAGRAAFSAACVARNGDLLAHVSTADNARDLDLLRQAVGEEMLNDGILARSANPLSRPRTRPVSPLRNWIGATVIVPERCAVPAMLRRSTRRST